MELTELSNVRLRDKPVAHCFPTVSLMGYVQGCSLTLENMRWCYGLEGLLVKGHTHRSRICC